MTTAHAIEFTSPIQARVDYRVAANARVWWMELDDTRRAWIAVGSAHQSGHEACETCPYCVLEASEDDLSRVDSDCLIGSNGESPYLCPALKGAA